MSLEGPPNCFSCYPEVQAGDKINYFWQITPAPNIRKSGHNDAAGAPAPLGNAPRFAIVIQNRVFALVFTGLRTVADARCSRPVAFAPRFAELRRFAAKNLQTVEDDREITLREASCDFSKTPFF